MTEITLAWAVLFVFYAVAAVVGIRRYRRDRRERNEADLERDYAETVRLINE